MKAGTLLVALAVAGVCLAGIVWMAGGVESISIRPSNPAAEEASPLEISKTGPWPKAVALETDHRFELMSVGEEASHVFHVKNEGEAPLRLLVGETTCKCTLSKLEKDEIAVGEEVEVVLTWTPETAQDEFMQMAKIHTNDPENRLIRLSVAGPVQKILELDPPDVWNLGNVSKSQETALTGDVYSGVLDEFQISSVESKSEHVKTKIAKLSPEDLAARNAKSGYRISVSLDPKQMTVGTFEERLIIHTDVKGNEDLPVQVKGTFVGAIQALPYVPKGEQVGDLKWYPEVLAINLGRFQATQGRVGWYSLRVADVPQGQPLVREIVANPEVVKVKVEEHSTPLQTTRQAFIVTFEVPPNNPPAQHQGKGAVKVLLKTNHPDVPEIKFYVEFVAL